MEARFLSALPALEDASADDFKVPDKSSLLESVGFDLLLAITRFAGLASTGGKSPEAAAEIAAAFAFSLRVVALLLCRTVLLRYRPSGSFEAAVLRCCDLVDADVATLGESESSSSERACSASGEGDIERLRLFRLLD